MESDEKDYRIVNPLIAGESYECEMFSDFGGCCMEHPAENIICIADTGVKFCRDCYLKFREMQVKSTGITEQAFDEKCFFGPGDDHVIESRQKAIDEMKVTAEQEEVKRTIMEQIKQRELDAEMMRDKKRYQAQCEDFKLRRREYMREYMKDRNQLLEEKEKLRERGRRLKEQFKNDQVVDNTTPVCPRCGNPKCGKAGYIFNTFGKIQRRRCPICRYIYTIGE